MVQGLGCALRDRRRVEGLEFKGLGQFRGLGLRVLGLAA